MFEGNYADLLKSGTLTGVMLNASKKIKDNFRTPNNWFALTHATTHNLKNVSLELPLGIMSVIVGVAGSGKSSLMEAFRNQYQQPEDIVYISQKNIGISMRSTPATYMEVADDIRKMFAKANKCKAELFSFNGKGGCSICQGKGVIVSDMAFMDSIETGCEACGGLRYSNDVLQFKLKNLNIAQVMDLSVQKAYELFIGTIIAEKLEPLLETGLGYIHLNQSLSTLSGGELQRIKLASFLRKKGKIFILDEPTDGLHLKDIDRLISLFDTMVSAGNTIFLIEHNLEVLKSSDYVIEIGPGGGNKGGEVIFTGTPRDMINAKQSITAQYL